MRRLSVFETPSLKPSVLEGFLAYLPIKWESDADQRSYRMDGFAGNVAQLGRNFDCDVFTFEQFLVENFKQNIFSQ